MSNILLGLIKEFYQLLFIGSLLFIIYKFSIFAINIYRNYKLDTNDKYVSYEHDKILFWVCFTVILSFLI